MDRCDRLLTADIEIYFGDLEYIEHERLLSAIVALRFLKSFSRFYSTVLLRLNVAYFAVPLLSAVLLCSRIDCFLCIGASSSEYSSLSVLVPKLLLSFVPSNHDWSSES